MLSAAIMVGTLRVKMFCDRQTVFDVCIIALDKVLFYSIQK